MVLGRLLMRKVFRLLIVLSLLVFQQNIVSAQVFLGALRSVENQLNSDERKKVGSAVKKSQTVQDLVKNGSHVNLQAHNGKFICFDSAMAARAAADKPDLWERLQLVEVSAGKFALFGVHGYFASADIGADRAPLSARSKWTREWEIFEITVNGDDSISLKGANGKYLSVEPNGDIFVCADKIDTWEKLRVTAAANAPLPDLATGMIVGLQNEHGNRYFSVDQDRDYSVRVDATEARVWERFRLVSYGGCRFSFQADNGWYLSPVVKNKVTYLYAVEAEVNSAPAFNVLFGKDDSVYLRCESGSFVSRNGSEAMADKDEAAMLRLKVLPAEDESGFVTIISKNGLRCGYIKEFTSEWNSKNLGVAADISVHRPKTPKGWAFLGDALAPGDEKPVYSSMIILDDPNSLQKPEGYEEIWSSRDGKAGSSNASIWQPVAPKGYVALGLVVTTDGKKPEKVPSLGNLRCIRQDLVIPGRAARPVWNDKGSGLARPISLFVVGRDAGDEVGLPPGTFLGAWFNDRPVGGATEVPFTELARSSDWYLAGFKVRSGGLIDNIRPVFRKFADAGEEYEGEKRGGNGGKEYSLIADKDWAVSGISGRNGSMIDQLKVQFRKLNGRSFTAKDNKESKSAGGDGGGDFSMGGHGCLFQGVDVYTGNFVNSIGLVPMPMSQAWVIPALKPEEIHADVLKGLIDLHLEQNRDEILDKAVEEFVKKNPGLQNQSESTSGAESENASLTVEIPDMSVAEAGSAAETLSGGTAVESGSGSGSATNLKQEFEKAIAGQKVAGDLFLSIETISKLLGFQNPRFELNQEMLSLLADMQLRLSEKIQTLLKVSVEIPLSDTKTKGILVKADIPGKWENPLGINGLSLQKMGFGGNFALGAKGGKGILPTLFVKGAMDIGLKSEIEMLGAYNPDFPGISGLIASMAEVSWQDVVGVANFFLKAATVGSKATLPAPGFPFDTIKVKNAEFMISKVTAENLDLVTGTRLRGDFIFDDKKLGWVEVLFSPEGKTVGTVQMQKVSVGPLQLTAPSDAKNKNDGPLGIINHTKDSNKFSVKGKVVIAGSPMEYIQEISDVMKIQISGDFGGVLQLTLLGTANAGRKNLFPDGGLELAGKVDTAFIQSVQGLVISSVQNTPGLGKFAGAFAGSILSIRSIEVKGSLDKIAGGNLPEMVVDCRIAGKSMQVGIRNVKVSASLVSTIVSELTEKVIEQTGDLAKQFAEAVEKVVKEFVGNIEDQAKEIADEAKKVAEESGKAVSEAVSQIGDFSRDAGNKAKDYGESAIKSAVSVVGNVGKGIKKFLGF